jgi:hypothetical protein
MRTALKILKSPKTETVRSYAKMQPLAEIILFPNGNSEAYITNFPDPETKTRWLYLGDEALKRKHKA